MWLNAYAEFVAAPALHLVRKPASLSHVEAAALPVVGLTAWQGELRVHVQEVFPFDRIADAHRLLDAGHLQGKLVLTV
ncbi:zinc-binding dehydrogenase [Amycolatopsis thermalba]|uniref:zinc-binding dehydrogenase n=1 Tax=Amycolatopsis TaxID=1813 RepID=UPI003D21418D